jgi:hypothetical protein
MLLRACLQVQRVGRASENYTFLCCLTKDSVIHNAWLEATNVGQGFMHGFSLRILHDRFGGHVLQYLPI